MGLFDSLLGRTKPIRPNLDALFALPSAAVTLQLSEGLDLSGHAGICWKSPAGQSATDVKKEIAELLAEPTLTQAEDSYGYQWLLLDDPDAETLVTRVHLVNTSLTENGWGPQLLCSVFGLVPSADAGPDVRALYLVYLYKRGTFYPFAPDGKEHRDSELELRTRAVLGSDLPVEQDLQRWFPLWDLPVR
ncbi:MAG TPA: hypothetical protein VHW47_10125 [Acidimicrobiales bacterium]|nr:hypothetical protein [Acidimicrobiales bacterium]